MAQLSDYNIKAKVVELLLSHSKCHLANLMPFFILVDDLHFGSLMCFCLLFLLCPLDSPLPSYISSYKVLYSVLDDS